MSNAVSAGPVRPAPTSGALETLEYALRLVFFAAVPFAIVLLAALVPMTAALVNIVLALGAFFYGEVLRKHAQKRGWLGAVLRRQLAFEEYYRERPPKPFLYYLAYPLLFPYWLAVREARREFWLFKGYTIVTFLVAAVAGVYRYFAVYQPEIGLKVFLQSFGIGLVIEALAVITFLMPIATTVVALHKKAQHGRLIALLVVGLLSAAVAVGILARRHRTFPSIETRQRVAKRTFARLKVAESVADDALRAAWRERRKKNYERESDGTVEGAPLDVAREKLGAFYRPDEAAAFELWTTARGDKHPMMILYAEGPRRGKPVFRAMRADGTIVERAKELPKSALKVMRTVGEL
jgi:hypothetical protein